MTEAERMAERLETEEFYPGCNGPVVWASLAKSAAALIRKLAAQNERIGALAERTAERATAISDAAFTDSVALNRLKAENAAKDKRIAELVEALKPFADRADRYDPHEDNDDQEPDWSTAAPDIRIGDLRCAREALNDDFFAKSTNCS